MPPSTMLPHGETVPSVLREVSTAVSRLFARADGDCENTAASNSCEKPNAGTNVTSIVVGTIFGVILIGVVTVLAILHRRRQRMDKREWPKNNQELNDYGLGGQSVAKPKGAYRPPQVDNDEENPKSSQQGRRSSRDSLRSLENSLRQQQAKPTEMV